MTTTTAPTTGEQVNRLRTVLAWLEDNAHTLPDGWSLLDPIGEYPGLTWVVDDPAATIARLIEAHGRPEWSTAIGAQWSGLDDRPVRLSVYPPRSTR